MSECSCKQILNIIPKCDPALNVQPKCPVTLNVVETQRGAPGKDATINGVNVLEIIATDGITGTTEGETFTISGQELQDDIIAENNRAIEAEETLDNKIDSEAATRADEIARVEGLISSEETRAKDVEGALQANIVAEENRARGVEQELSNSIEDNRQEIGNHISDKDNPHEVTKAQVGLGSVENLAPADMPMSTATKTYVDNADTNLQGQITTINTTISGYGDIVTHNANEFATADQGALADTALQPTDNISELTNNLNYQTAAQVANSIAVETSNRESADNNLQSQIDAIVSASDVFDIVGTYAELQAYDITTVPVNNIIKVLVDSTHGGAASYYRCVESGGVKSWEYIGSEGAYYTKGEADSKFVPQTRTVNGKSLSNDITLTASDVGALPSSTIIPTVNDATLTIQKNGANIGTFTANSATNSTINVVVPTDTSDLTNNAGYATKTYVDTELLNKQNVLTAGDNIQITNNVISATDTTYTAGTGIDITNGVISNTQTSAQWGNITGTLSDQTDLQDALDAKQNTLTSENAGTNIEITGGNPTYEDVTVSGTSSVTLESAKENGLNYVKLFGACEQNGTPTPATPIDIVSNNGALKVRINLVNTANSTKGQYISSQGMIRSSVNWATSDYLPVIAGGKVTVSGLTYASSAAGFNYYDASKNKVSTIPYETGTHTYTVPNNASYIMITYRWEEDESTVKVYVGETLNAPYADGTVETVTDSLSNTATAEMLLKVGDYQDVQSILDGVVTRNVGVKVFDGTEEFALLSGVAFRYMLDNFPAGTKLMSNYFNGDVNPSKGIAEMPDLSIKGHRTATRNVYFKYTEKGTVKAFQQWLADQYANGTPVIIVYPLAEPTTETVTGQTLTIQEGTNVVSATGSVNSLPLEVEYEKQTIGGLKINFVNDSGFATTAELNTGLARKQDTLTQGTGIDITNNVVSVNGTVALKSDIPTVNDAILTINQGGVIKGTFSANASTNTIVELDAAGSTYTAGNGINISGTTISVANPTLVNTATGTNALSTGTAVASGAQSLALGHYAEATASGGVAIGQEATSDAIGAVQIGFGTNDEAGTFKVSLTTDGENYAQYTLLNSDGEIPSDRLGEATGTLANNNYVLTYGSNTGVWKKYTAPTVDQTYSATSQNAQSGLAVAGAIANKADNSLANLSVAGLAYAAHLPMPGGNQVTFTLGASGSTYTAPGDGWIYVSISCTGVKGVTYVSLYNNTKAFGTKSDLYRASTATVLAQRCVIPVSKGDVAAISYSMGTPSSSTCKFIYANGAS